MSRGKKILITALAAALLLSMSGCGGKTSSGDTSKDKKQKTSSTQTKSKSNKETKSKSKAILTGTHTKMIGSIKLKAVQIPVKPALTTSSTFNTQIAAHGNKVYILSDSKLMEYSYQSGQLKLQKTRSFGDHKYTHMDASRDGTVRLSDFMDPYIGLRKGKQIFEYDDLDDMVISPSGKWGISYFSDAQKAQRVTFQKDRVVKQDFPFKQVKTIRYIDITDSSILVSGSSAKDSNQYVFVYDYNRNLKTVLKDSDGSGLGSITVSTFAKNRYIGLDGNLRSIDLWDASGKWIGNAKTSDLFGVSYPWLSDGQLMDDGSLLVTMTQKRDDNKTIEVLIYRVSGF